MHAINQVILCQCLHQHLSMQNINFIFGKSKLYQIMIDPICQKCRKSKQPENNHAKVSLGFIYHIALDLQFSFQSIAMLSDFAKIRQAKKLSIGLHKIVDLQNIEIPDQHYEQNYVQIKFDDNGLTSNQAQQLARSFYSKANGGMQLVLGMFGLGKTGLFINNNGAKKSVIMFSVDDRVNPNYFKEEQALLYIENRQTKCIENLNGKMMKQVIVEGLKIYHPNPQKVLQCGQKQTKILIFHPKIFVSSNKLMFYEIRQSNLGHDIDTHYNPQKIQFLNKLGYEMSIHSEFRLSCYLSCLYLQSPFAIRIGDSQLPICKTTYLQYLQHLRNNNVLEKMNNVKLNGATRVQIFETKDKYFIQNNGILLYWKGRLINRFQVQFGRMVEQKFYKKRYRSPPRNIWNVVGIVQLDHTKFTPNLIKNKFINTFEYRRFSRDLQTLIESIEKKISGVNSDNAQNEQRNIKEDSQDEFQNSEPRKRVKRGKEDGYLLE